MKSSKPASASGTRIPWCPVLLVAALLFLFFQSFLPGYVHFNNDGPLGQQMAAWSRIPGSLFGSWYDLNSIGSNSGAYPPSVSALVRWLLGPVGVAKFLAPVALLILGLGAWTLFRQMRLSPLAATLGSLAAMLNSTFFSAACWGVATQEIAVGMSFLALALVMSIQPGMPVAERIARLGLAGLAVGMNVMEAADIGGLFSLLIAAFVVYRTLAGSEGKPIRRIAGGVGSVMMIAVCAGLIAASSLSAIIGTQIKGVSGMRQEEQNKLERWDWATQWSLPKRETLALFMPGIFGYRMDSPNGANYWGGMGRSPAIDRYFDSGAKGEPPPGIMRFSGGGNYTGVLVTLIGLWAAFQSFRKSDSAFALAERKLIWFWIGVSVVCLLLAYGRFAPFYQVLYTLPYFSTIRNPAKFLNLFSFAAVMLFAYGAHGLSRRHLEVETPGAPDLNSRLKNWWARAGAFDKRWTIGCIAAVGLTLLSWLIYSSSRPSLMRYLETIDAGGVSVSEVAGFSIRQVGWFALYLAVSVGAVILILTGAFRGRRAGWAAILLGAILITDLGRADLNWVVHWNYEEKYETRDTNPIIRILRQNPFEHRVAILPFRSPPELALFDQLYRIEWAQHHFPYYNIQSLDVIQMSRVAEDLAAFESALRFQGTEDTLYRLTRRWALTNTRYLLGPAGFLELLNGQLDPGLRRFKILETFNVVPRPGISRPTRLDQLTAERNPTGPYALFEFTGALPRAKLYSNWQLAAGVPPPGTPWTSALSATNDTLTLEKLASPAFDPDRTVLLASPIPASTNPPAASLPGTVEFKDYSPKDIKLQTRSEVPTILLLNDKYDPNWRVRVDGQPAELLRCNFIMRGVHLPPGSHLVEFSFRLPNSPLYVSLAGIGLGVIFAGVALFGKRNRRASAEGPATPAGSSGAAHRPRQ